MDDAAQHLILEHAEQGRGLGDDPPRAHEIAEAQAGERDVAAGVALTADVPGAPGQRQRVRGLGEREVVVAAVEQHVGEVLVRRLQHRQIADPGVQGDRGPEVGRRLVPPGLEGEAHAGHEFGGHLHREVPLAAAHGDGPAGVVAGAGWQMAGEQGAVVGEGLGGVAGGGDAPGGGEGREVGGDRPRQAKRVVDVRETVEDADPQARDGPLARGGGEPRPQQARGEAGGRAGERREGAGARRGQALAEVGERVLEVGGRLR